MALKLSFARNLALKFSQNLNPKSCQKPFESQIVLLVISGQNLNLWVWFPYVYVVAINRGRGVELKSSYLVLSLSLLHIRPYLPLPTIAFHIEVIPLVDGTYELIQEPDVIFSEVQANIVDLTEAPNSDSEKPKVY